MAIYARLLTLNKRPVEETLKTYMQIAAGEFRHDNAESRYAEAYANYWVGYLTSRPDVVARWLDAYKLKPTKGFAARELPLPDKPLLK